MEKQVLLCNLHIWHNRIAKRMGEKVTAATIQNGEGEREEARLCRLRKFKRQRGETSTEEQNHILSLLHPKPASTSEDIMTVQTSSRHCAFVSQKTNHVEDRLSKRRKCDRSVRTVGRWPGDRCSVRAMIIIVLVMIMWNPQHHHHQRRLLQFVVGQDAGENSEPQQAVVPTQTPSMSIIPTMIPSLNPTSFPSITSAPTRSYAPSHAPTLSFMPTGIPSISPRPSIPPSGRPTLTAYPSGLPSIAPSSKPSNTPTRVPPDVSRERYQQVFVVPNESFFIVPNETDKVMGLYQNYTAFFAPPEDAPFVETTCIFRPPQKLFPDPNNTAIFRNTMDYTCSYASYTVDIEQYPILFFNYVNSNLENTTQALQALGLNITAVLPVQILIVQTDAPTSSEAPSAPPSPYPTITAPPSKAPSGVPSPQPRVPTQPPTRDFFSPTVLPTIQIPAGGTGIPVPAIASIVVLGGVAILVVLVIFYRRRVKQRQSMRRSEARQSGAQGGAVGGRRPGQQPMVGPSKSSGDSEGVIAAMSPSGSIGSGRSMLSEGDEGIGGDSGDEFDNTRNLQDEFDQYKDQNLELLRSEVEGNLTGFEGVMSAAVTKALMGEDIQMDMRELLWGCRDPATGAEIEASALCDVSDWLKRNENASIERKNKFMQDMLNKMVASVRHNKLQADDASRTIHESAALLGLPIANELPMTTMIISGMRKTVSPSQIVNVLDEFGDIDTAAVASGERGFGIVRFRHPKSVDRAMRRFRNAEIVIEDVAVQLKVLMPSGEVVSRT